MRPRGVKRPPLRCLQGSRQVLAKRQMFPFPKDRLLPTNPGCSTPLPYIPNLRHSHHLSTSKIMARHQTWTVTPILKHKRRFHSHYMRKHAATQILSQSTLPHNYYLLTPLSAPHQPVLAWASLSSTSQRRCIIIAKTSLHNAFFAFLRHFGSIPQPRM